MLYNYKYNIKKTFLSSWRKDNLWR